MDLGKEAATENALKPMALEEVEEYVNDCIRDGKKRDLSYRDLHGLDLRLVGGGSLARWNFTHTNLRDAILPLALNDAVFTDAELQGANLDNASLNGVDFGGARLSGAHIRTESLRAAKLEWVRWENDYRIGNETLADGCKDPKIQAGLYKAAGGVYRQLKQAYQLYGLFDLAGEFYFREMECDRKFVGAQLRSTDRTGNTLAIWVHLSLSGLTFGYGERPWNLVKTAAAVFLLFTMLYYLGGLYHGRGVQEFLQSAYFSLVSFTAVGYGGWIDASLGAVKYLGGIEALFGTFILALFLVAFTRGFGR